MCHGIANHLRCLSLPLQLCRVKRSGSREDSKYSTKTEQRHDEGNQGSRVLRALRSLLRNETGLSIACLSTQN